MSLEWPVERAREELECVCGSAEEHNWWPNLTASCDHIDVGNHSISFGAVEGPILC